MASNEETVNQESVDEAALNEEASRELAAMVAEAEQTSLTEEEGDDDTPLSSPQSHAERAAVIEALIFVSDEPLSVKTIADVLKEDKAVISEAAEALAQEFNAIGDPDGARSLAQEVLAEASGDLKNQARRFLAEIS